MIAGLMPHESYADLFNRARQADDADRVAVAYHEAGHGVVATALGRRVGRMQVEQSGGRTIGETAGDMRLINGTGEFDCAVIGMSGLVAEAMFAGKIKTEQDAAGSDAERVAACCPPGVDPQEWANRAGRRAASLLRTYSNQVYRIAGDLMNHGAVGGNHRALAGIRKAVAALRARTRKTAQLRAAAAFTETGGGITVDARAGIIYNVAVATIGPAKGHGFSLDSTSIDQIVELAQAQPDGVKSRFKHPEISESNGRQQVADDTGTVIGRVRNVRRVGDQARGDIHLGSYAKSTPGLGNVFDYVIGFAQSDPAGIGLSAMFSFEVEPVTDDFGNVVSVVARIFSLEAIDVVSEPAANPNGLLSAKRAGVLFDPQPPSAVARTPGWQDPKPADLPRTPIPVSTPEFPHDVRGDYLRTIVKHGPMSLGGIASRHNGRLDEMHAACEWLADNGHVDRVPGKAVRYQATPKGMTHAALCWSGSRAA